MANTTPAASGAQAPKASRTAMPIRRVILLGGGGHAKVVAESALAAGLEIVGFLDDNPDAELASLGFEHLGEMVDRPSVRADACHVAIGENRLRRSIAEHLQPGSSPYDRLATIVDPSARVSPSANLGDGVFIGPHAVVNASATVGPGAIINTAAVVEHDNTIGAFAHIAPGAVLGGNVRVGDQALVGLGARVLPGLRIGPRALVGAGAVVTRSIGPGSRAVGVPARGLGEMVD